MYDFLHKALKMPYELHSAKHGDWSEEHQPVIVLVHGIGVNHRIWDDVIAQLAPAPILAVDLLGFGASRKPDWTQYSLADHAKALQKTIRRKSPGRKLIICGHSLGSLVAVEYNKLFPRDIRSLVLCSPPIHRPEDIAKRPLREAVIKAAGKRLLAAIQATPQLIDTMNRYRLMQPQFYISPEGAKPYLRTATNSLLRQTSFEDTIALPDIPLVMIYGTLDVVMVPKNFRDIKRARASSHTVIKTTVAGHEIRKRYGKVIVETLRSLA